MEWLIKLFESPINKNITLFRSTVKAGLWIALASIIFEYTNGKYRILDIKEINPLFQYFDSGLIWLSLIYLIYSYLLYQLVFHLMSFLIKGCAKLSLKHFFRRVRFIKQNITNKKTRQKVYKIAAPWIPIIAGELHIDKAKDDIGKYAKIAVNLNDSRKQFTDTAISLLFLFVVMHLKHLPQTTIALIIFSSGFIIISVMAFVSAVGFYVMENMESLITGIVESEEKTNMDL